MKCFVTLIITLCMICCYSTVALADEETITAAYRDKIYTGTLRDCQEQAQTDFGGCVCGYLYLPCSGKLYNVNIHEEERQYYLDGTGEDIDATPEPTLTPTPVPTSTPVPRLTVYPSTKPAATVTEPSVLRVAVIPANTESAYPSETLCGRPLPKVTATVAIIPSPVLNSATPEPPTTSTEPTAEELHAGEPEETGPCPCVIRQKIAAFFTALWTWFMNLIT